MVQAPGEGNDGEQSEFMGQPHQALPMTPPWFPIPGEEQISGWPPNSMIDLSLEGNRTLCLPNVNHYPPDSSNIVLQEALANVNEAGNSQFSIPRWRGATERFGNFSRTHSKSKSRTQPPDAACGLSRTPANPPSAYTLQSLLEDPEGLRFGKP